jgi:hypothetical protein
MKHKLINILIFISIIALAAYLRLWHLGGVPVSINWDEAALGYNAYSILKTGKDEYGIRFPLILKSFGNYTPAMYAYLAIPAIVKYDLTPFSIRLPSAIMGIFAVLGTFLLSYELFALAGFINTKKTAISLLTSFLLAISPWHLQFSRVAYEANIALTFCIWGLYFFLKGIKQPGYLIFSAVSYGLSVNTYHSPRLFVPVFLASLAVIFRKELLIHKRYVIMAFLSGLIFFIPILYLLFGNHGESVTARFATTSIFAGAKTKMDKSGSLNSTFMGKLFNSTASISLNDMWSGYLSHFSFRWLFITGDNDRHHAPSTGLLYLWELPFIILGLISLNRLPKKFRQIILIWLFAVPIPASLTTEVPHAVRTLIWLPLFQILSALGLITTWTFLRRLHLTYRIIISSSVVIIALFQFGEYLQLYQTHLNLESSRFWQFGYEHAVNFVNENHNKYQKIIVSNHLEQPYIFFLFYEKFNPADYLAKGGTSNTDSQSFGKFEFRTVDWSKKAANKGSLYLLDPQEALIAPIDKVVHVIHYFDGSEAMTFAE